jgi:TPR repeat protein
MHRLALAELNGELGCSRRPREGVRWLKRAAELADQVDPPQPKSLHELAMLHEKGIENVIFQVSRAKEAGVHVRYSRAEQVPFRNSCSVVG